MNECSVCGGVAPILREGHGWICVVHARADASLTARKTNPSNPNHYLYEYFARKLNAARVPSYA